MVTSLANIYYSQDSCSLLLSDSSNRETFANSFYKSIPTSFMSIQNAIIIAVNYSTIGFRSRITVVFLNNQQ
jgi:hypothetical protein